MTELSIEKVGLYLLTALELMNWLSSTADIFLTLLRSF